jgi:predicted RecA/RadA family phage recombinase
MAANMFGDGDSWDLPVPYAGGIVGGQGMLVGAFLFGVAMSTAAQNAIVAVKFHGIYDITKEAPLVIAQGAKLWWDNTNRRLTTTATGNLPVGIAVAAALSADTTVRVLLRPSPNVAA